MSFPLIEFITLTLTTTFTPGPNNIMCMTLGQNVGFKKTLPYVFGVMIGYGTLLVLVATFNRLVLLYFPFMNFPLRMLGTGYLVYLAGIILYSAFKTSDSQKEVPLIPEDRLFITSTLFQFVNPKALLFALSIFSTYILPYFQDAYHMGLAIVYLLFITVCSLMLWSGCGSILQNFIQNHKKPFNSVMATLLLYCAINIALH